MREILKTKIFTRENYKENKEFSFSENKDVALVELKVFPSFEVTFGWIWGWKEVGFQLFYNWSIYKEIFYKQEENIVETLNNELRDIFESTIKNHFWFFNYEIILPDEFIKNIFDIRDWICITYLNFDFGFLVIKTNKESQIKIIEKYIYNSSTNSIAYQGCKTTEEEIYFNWDYLINKNLDVFYNKNFWTFM